MAATFPSSLSSPKPPFLRPIAFGLSVGGADGSQPKSSPGSLLGFTSAQLPGASCLSVAFPDARPAHREWPAASPPATGLSSGYCLLSQLHCLHSPWMSQMSPAVLHTAWPLLSTFNTTLSARSLLCTPHLRVFCSLMAAVG